MARILPLARKWHPVLNGKRLQYYKRPRHLYINSLRARTPVSISSEPNRRDIDVKHFLGRSCLSPAILITIGHRLAGDKGKKTTNLAPIVRHFDVVPGSLVCDVMLSAVPNGDVIVRQCMVPAAF
jgi:hypothetical protein